MVKTKNKVILKEIYAKAPKTKDASVGDDSGAVIFNDRFACLGTILHFLLDRTMGIVSRMSK